MDEKARGSKKKAKPGKGRKAAAGSKKKAKAPRKKPAKRGKAKARRAPKAAALPLSVERMKTAGLEAVSVSTGKTIRVSALGAAATTEVRVTSQHGAVGIWPEGEVDPGPKVADIPPGEIWALDFFSRFSRAGEIVYRIVELAEGRAPVEFSEPRAGAAAQTVVFRHIVFG